MAEQIFMGTVRLHPLAQCEIERKPPTLLGRLVRGTFPVRRGRRLGEELATRIAGGGFPAPLARKTSARRAQWYADYIDSLVQRDVRDLARIGSLHALPKLLRLSASQTARLLNVLELAGAFQISRPTIRDYVPLLAGVKRGRSSFFNGCSDCKKVDPVPLFRLRKIETISGNRKSGAVRLWALAENVSEVAPRGLLPCRHEP